MVLHSNRSQAEDILHNLQETTEKSYQEVLGHLVHIADDVRTLRDDLQTQPGSSCSSVFSRIARIRNDMTVCEFIARCLENKTAPSNRNFPEIQKLPYGGSLITRNGTAHDHLMSQPNIFGRGRFTTKYGIDLVTRLNGEFNRHHLKAASLKQSLSDMAAALSPYTRHSTDDSPKQLTDQQKSELLQTLTRIEQTTDRHIQRIKISSEFPIRPL